MRNTNSLVMTNRERIDLIDNELFFFRYNEIYADVALALTEDSYAQSANRLYKILTRQPIPNYLAVRLVMTLRKITDFAERRHETSEGKKIEPTAKADATFCAALYYSAKMKLAEIARQQAESTEASGDTQTATAHRQHAEQLEKEAARFKTVCRYLPKV